MGATSAGAMVGEAITELLSTGTLPKFIAGADPPLHPQPEFGQEASQPSLLPQPQALPAFRRPRKRSIKVIRELPQPQSLTIAAPLQPQSLATAAPLQPQSLATAAPQPQLVPAGAPQPQFRFCNGRGRRARTLLIRPRMFIPLLQPQAGAFSHPQPAAAGASHPQLGAALINGAGESQLAAGASQPQLAAGASQPQAEPSVPQSEPRLNKPLIRPRRRPLNSPHWLPQASI